MKPSIETGILLWIFAPVLIAASLADADKAAIDRATGAKGVYTAAEDTYRVAFPRTDIKVTVEGRTMAPFMGFSSWAAFTSATQGGVIVMGDIVLLEDEVNPAMSAALDAGLEVTALHNHFFYESPRVMYMHIGGTGNVQTLAPAVKKVFDRIASVRSAAPTPPAKFAGAAVPDTNSITASDLDAILGVKGEVNNGMYKVTIGRDATMHGAKVSKQMGVNTWAAFAGTDASALVDGDFAMTSAELQPVLKALRKANINIVAIHNHMTHEQPQYVFLHYWGKGPAKELARGLKSALDEQARVGGSKAEGLRNVLFVCEHGAAKSVIASAEFNRLAEQRGISWRASFRGTSPDADIAPAVARSLRNDGLTVAGKPSIVTLSDVEAASRVITFSTKLPPAALPTALREWNDVPSPSADVQAARQDIRLRVAKLLDEIAGTHH